MRVTAGMVARVRALTTGADGRLIVVCRNDGERDRFRDFLVERGLVPSDRLRLLTGKLDRGFRLSEAATTVVSHGEFLGTGEVRRPTRREVTIPSRAIASFFDLQPGELVVHAVHGVARYEGLTVMERMGGVEDLVHLGMRGLAGVGEQAVGGELVREGGEALDGLGRPLRERLGR